MLKKQKTVYILGAGFSYEAGFPLQTDILRRIQETKVGLLSGDTTDDFLLLSELFLAHQERSDTLKEFLTRVFSSSVNPSLEDVFTLLDQTIAKRGFCLKYSWKELNEINDSLKRAILTIFHYSADKLRKNPVLFYNQFACHLLEERFKNGLAEDSISVISLNWDTLIEDRIYECIESTQTYKKIDVDYCSYTTPIHKDCLHTPSLIQKAKKIYNLKILKLHGSINWLLCPNCNRLHTGLGSKESIWNLYVKPRKCESCKILSDAKEAEKIPDMEPLFVTPTFTKVFDNTHIQMVWHNAHVEIAEADRIVFIGYSLPEADYHFRTLIKRAIRSDTFIDVVLKRNDKISRDTKPFQRKFFAETRYRNFFGENRVRFYWDGVGGYFRDTFKGMNLTARLKRIKKSMESVKRRK
ncbi:MAG: hypothetical protein H6754_08930 [Candidatus Omnitrophica bacterium]|nr:hypothetical protein [Candidatus Omnitrophota bacterium]